MNDASQDWDFAARFRDAPTTGRNRHSMIGKVSDFALLQHARMLAKIKRQRQNKAAE